ncbi:hypothetical protein L7F22_039556 [Adiantum nelumboides]|nr:hypothetical protein [Adiantum nelumboides]
MKTLLAAADERLSSWPWLAAALLCFVGTLVYQHYYSWCLRNYKQLHHVPPGSLGLPLVGEMLQFSLFSKSPIGTPLPFFSSRFRRYGSVFKTHLVGRPTVVSMDPELTKFLLSNEDKLLHAYVPKYFTKFLGPIVYLSGPTHRAFRDVANLCVSSTAVQKLHVETVQEHLLACLSSWLKHAESPSSINVVDAQKHCREWVFTYSIKYFLGLEADDPLTLALMPDFFLISTGYASIPINLPGTKFNKVVKAYERIKSTVAQVVRSRKLQSQVKEKDFLDILLKRADEDGQYCSGIPVADWIFAFVWGGYENTATLFINIIKFLSENEHVVDELRKEHFGIRKGSLDQAKKLTWDDYRKMHLTKNVLKETLRLASITQHVFRKTLEDIHFKDVVFLASTQGDMPMEVTEETLQAVLDEDSVIV